ncbi:phage major tail tube protein [Pseudovibrio ascidiaceicola]|uniref:phage major tail tube protein n=1 Tax=Pseudovibrio ascidiaceicola TaxID=285279 RepID=UPI003D36DAC7
MARTPALLRMMRISVDGSGYIGDAESWQPPEIAAITEEVRGSATYGTYLEEMGQQAMQSTLTFKGAPSALFKTYGLLGMGKPIIVRQSKQAQGVDPIPRTYKMTAVATSIAQSEQVTGQMDTMTVTFSLNHYEIVEDGKEVLYIDVKNVIHRIFGNDILAAHRKNIGLA